ncbi:MAG: MFS transporter [Alkalispirochaeta sp.]
MAAVYIIITFAFIYGEQVIRWDPGVQIYMFVIVQITAALGAIVFGFIQNRIGAKQTYVTTMALWTVGIVLIYATPQITEMLNRTFGTEWHPQHIFLFVGIITGVSLGSSQSAGRAMVGLFSPDSKSSEFFGFWGLSGKLAGVFGVIGLGLLQSRFGLQTAILFCAALFITSIVVVLFVDQERGRRAADEYVPISSGPRRS